MASQLRQPSEERNAAYHAVKARDVLALVQAHAKLDDSMTAAIWIYQDSREVWLIEIVPSMFDDERANIPIQFNPTTDFRWPLKLFAVNLSNIQDVILKDPELAAAIADGDILYEDDHHTGQNLQALARQILSGASHGIST